MCVLPKLICENRVTGRRGTLLRYSSVLIFKTLDAEENLIRSLIWMMETVIRLFRISAQGQLGAEGCLQLFQWSRDGAAGRVLSASPSEWLQ